jgi:integrase
MPASSDSNHDVDARARTWLKPDQVEELRDVCLSDAVPTYLQDRNEAIITLLYDAGLRAGELCALDVDHLDLDARMVYLPSAIQKGSPPPATLELNRETTRVLRRYLRDRWKETPALFPSRSSDRLTTSSLQHLIETFAVAADIKPQRADGGTGEPTDVTSHTLRHSVAYRIIQVDGGRLEDVQLRLRHANRQTTDQIYSYLIPR